AVLKYLTSPEIAKATAQRVIRMDAADYREHAHGEHCQCDTCDWKRTVAEFAAATRSDEIPRYVGERPVIRFDDTRASPSIAERANARLAERIRDVWCKTDAQRERDEEVGEHRRFMDQWRADQRSRLVDIYSRSTILDEANARLEARCN